MTENTIDAKTRSDVENFAGTFSKLPPEAQKDVAVFALAVKAAYEAKEIKESLGEVEQSK